jgi:hypothetical protein
MIFYSWASQHNCVSTMDVKDHRVAFRGRFMGTAYSVGLLGKAACLPVRSPVHLS